MIIAGEANGGALEHEDVEADGALDRGGSVETDRGAPENGGVEADRALGRGGSLETDGVIDRGGRSAEADWRGGAGVAAAASLLLDGIDMFVVI